MLGLAQKPCWEGVGGSLRQKSLDSELDFISSGLWTVLLGNRDNEESVGRDKVGKGGTNFIFG